MKYYHLFEVVFPACYLAIACWLMLTAVRGLLSQRPAVVPARVSFMLTSLFLTPIFIFCVTVVLYGPRNGGPDWNEFGVAAIPIALIVCWFLTNGYTIIGARRSSLVKALQSIAESRDWQFEEGLSPMLRRRSSPQLVLLGRPWIWFGIVRSGSGAGRLEPLEEEVLSRLAESQSAFASRACLLQLLLGFILACTAIGIYFLA